MVSRKKISKKVIIDGQTVKMDRNFLKRFYSKPLFTTYYEYVTENGEIVKLRNHYHYDKSKNEFIFIEKEILSCSEDLKNKIDEFNNLSIEKQKNYCQNEDL